MNTALDYIIRTMATQMAKFLIPLTCSMALYAAPQNMQTFEVQADPDDAYMYKFQENLGLLMLIKHKTSCVNCFEYKLLQHVRMQIDYLLGDLPHEDEVLLWKMNLMSR